MMRSMEGLERTEILANIALQIRNEEVLVESAVAPAEVEGVLVKHAGALVGAGEVPVEIGEAGLEINAVTVETEEEVALLIKNVLEIPITLDLGIVVLRAN